MREGPGYKQTYEWLLNLSWNDKRMKRMLNRYWPFTVGMKVNSIKDIRFHTDENDDLIYFFDKEMLEDDFKIVQ
jgi:hypothetical protein